ncbi:p49 [Hemileuca sp. nucleopolyhedrovirus]|uniref:p49 n=1 Tax=Hemileuca sp. nucleopolyhedrovirus TaxID=1367203 RepID=S5N942_9ABAC|nr:p49 [Hemileuca sp. nucleopolyhedrovirus]AGR56762.1 p49 [Hemileuca sp. nucleopolyhedrovirus]
MSVLNEKYSLEPRQYKYLFLATYFQLTDYEHISVEAKPFIGQYLKNNFDKLDENVLIRYLSYMESMKVRNLVADRNVDMFKYIKPQFKFTCSKNNLDILRFDDKVYIQYETPIYATNMFVADPSKFRVLMYKEFSQVFNERHFVNNSDTYCLINGTVGYVFEDAYLDWCGVRMCSASNKTVNESKRPFRLYLVGDVMARHFTENNIIFENTDDFKLKNFHKGLPLFRNNYRVINSKKFVTKKPNKVFDEIRTELNTHSAYVKLIQRDYIYDAEFNDDLLELLNDYMTETALYKFITKFNENDNMLQQQQTQRYNVYNEIVVDRYAANRYRKLNIKIDAITRFPSLRGDQPSHIMIHPDMIQIKGTLNAFYVPKIRIFVILANNSLFGSTEMLEFSPDLIQYTHNSPPKRLQKDTFIVNKTQKLYLTKFIFADTVPAYLLIRGDYESSFKSLNELKNTWVQNTLLKILITPDFVDRSLELADYNLRNNNI